MSEPSGTEPAASAERPIEAMSFEEALGELETIVQRLERGQLDLETSIGAYERGTELRRYCMKKLREAELRVEQLSLDKEGEVAIKPLDTGS